MAGYVECPACHDFFAPSLFLAGGIAEDPDWRGELRPLLAASPYVLVNPRRSAPAPMAVEAKIRWEYDHLHAATAILFWFSPGAVHPISLYELGVATMTGKPLFVGVHPDYPMTADVVVQTRLRRPDVEVVDSLPALAERVLARPPL
jgi:hypothetical protein